MIKKLSELKVFDIIVCDYSWFGRSSDVRYVVLINEHGDKVAVSFHSNCNDGIKPQGWYSLENEELNENNEWVLTDCLIESKITDAVAVYRPLHFSNTFNGELNNESYYELIWIHEKRE